LQSFQKFLTYKKDYNELLLYVLRQLVRESDRLQAMLGRGDEARVEVPFHDFQTKVGRSSPHAVSVAAIEQSTESVPAVAGRQSGPALPLF
jgi:hypothetical protein